MAEEITVVNNEEQREQDEENVHVINGELRVLSRKNDYLYDVELDLLDDRLTKNGWQYENLEAHRHLFAGKPILIAYTMGGSKIGDGHNMRTVMGRDGKEYASFTDADSERIIGALSDDEQDMRLVDRDGHRWIVGKGTIWAWYAHEAVEKIASQGRMDISIETIVTKNRMDGDVEMEEEYIPLGATILGDDVPPAVEGAGIRPLTRANADAFRELKLRAASYIDAQESKKGTAHEDVSKGVKHKVNRKVLSQVQSLFPEHRVLGVSDDMKVAVLSAKADGEISAYVFPEEDRDTILDSRFQSVNAEMSVTMEDGTEIRADMGEYDRRLNSELADMTSRYEQEHAAREQAEHDLSEIKAQQIKQRRSMAKVAAKRELADINAALNAEEMVEENALEAINNGIDAGEYDGCMNAEGEWDGCEKVCAAVQSVCMKAIKDSRSNRTHVNAWSAIQGMGGSDDAVLNSYNGLK